MCVNVKLVWFNVPLAVSDRGTDESTEIQSTRPSPSDRYARSSASEVNERPATNETNLSEMCTSSFKACASRLVSQIPTLISSSHSSSPAAWPALILNVIVVLFCEQRTHLLVVRIFGLAGMEVNCKQAAGHFRRLREPFCTQTRPTRGTSRS